MFKINIKIYFIGLYLCEWPSKDNLFTFLLLIHYQGKLDTQHSLAPQVLERINAINQNKQ